MFTYSNRKKNSFVFILMITLFSSGLCYAERGGFSGGYNHNAYGNAGTFNDDGSYNHGNEDNNADYYHSNGYYGGVDPAVVVGVPSTSCSTTQTCDAYGNCTQNQVCD